MGLALALEAGPRSSWSALRMLAQVHACAIGISSGHVNDLLNQSANSVNVALTAATSRSWLIACVYKTACTESVSSCSVSCASVRKPELI